ncbi:hypothetical protein PENSTE_c013G02789 [Penicillium steckii]|uniref:Zn(2)-C6 fungal-type domain-containing protein n=1 Tax=Penicillium steckii TaxID=303698 RepID=A0A1V6T3I4_9EURO|nr:hypothetical protein PENSTE_c013G02789 [Penicillium steckii]
MATPSTTTIPRKRPAPRLACNRCHAAKLRCIQSPTNQRCVRCIKAGTDCVHDPPSRLGRPRVHNLSPPDTIAFSSTQLQEPNSNTSPGNGTSFPTTNFKAATDFCSPRNLDADHTTAKNMKTTNPHKQATLHTDLGALAANESHSAGLDLDIGKSKRQHIKIKTRPLTESAVIEFHQSGAQSTQSDDPCYFTDFLNAGDNIDTSQDMPIESTDFYNNYNGPGYHDIQATHLSSNEDSAEDVTLALSQIMVNLTKIHHKLRDEPPPSSSPATGRRAARSTISDECFKSQLRANIQAAEQILETLGCINDDQAQREISNMAGPVQQESFGIFEKQKSQKARASTHRHRDTPPFPSPYSSAGDDQDFLHPPPVDSQNSITAMLVISIYLRLLHNFDILVSIMYTRIRDCESNTHFSELMGSGSEGTTNKCEPFSGPALHVSMGSCSFSSASAASLQLLFNVQLIDTFLAKVKMSIQRTILRPKRSASSGIDQDPFSDAFARENRYPIPPSAEFEPYHPSHRARHPRKPQTPQNEVTRGLNDFTTGIHSVTGGILDEMNHMDTSLQRRADYIKQWTIERP